MIVLPTIADGGLVIAGVGGMMLVFLAIALLLSVFWIWMLIDCLTSSMPPIEKLIWCLVIFFLHILGALLYYFIARPNHARAGIV